MKNKKIWITGGSGFLGSTICLNAQARFNVTGFYYKTKPIISKINYQQLDICDYKRVLELVSRAKPSYIIHAAAIANTTLCQMQPKLSEEVNVLATKHLSKACAENNIKLIYISTDLVFDGTSAPYSETDIPNPLMTYAKHKYNAEQEVLSASSNHLVVRLPLLIGRGPLPQKGYLNSLITSMQSGKEVFLFQDEYRTPLSVQNAARGVLQFKNESGILHLSGTSRTSRFQLGLMVKEAFDLENTKIKGTKQADQLLSSKRPSDVSLDCTKAIKLGFEPGLLMEELKKSANN